MARDSNSVQGNYNRKLGKRPRDHISHPLAPPSMHMPYLRIKQDPDHSKENSALSVFKTENNLHLPSNITPRVGVRGFVTAQPSPMSSRAALKRCITFPSVGEGSKTMLVKKAGTNDSVERATLRKLENVVNEENGQGRSDEVSKQKTGFSDANSLLSGQADEHEKFVASSQCPVLENVESTINVGVCLQDSPSPSPAETTEKMNETVDVPQKKVEPAADSPKGRDFVVPRKKRLRSETPQKKNLEEKMSQEKASVTVIEKKEERMDLSNRRETRASAKKKRASRAYEKIQTISDVDKKKRVNTKVSRKRGLLSEVLRLQKALETAVWTDSTVVQRQTEVMRVEEEDLFCKRKRRRSVTSPYMDRSSSYTKEAEQGLSLKRESGKDVKGGSKKASKGGVKKKRRTDPVHDKGASFSGEDGATYARRKRKTLFPKKLPRS